MKPVSSEELLYRIWRKHPKLYDHIYGTLRLYSEQDEDYEWLTIDDILRNVSDTYPNFIIGNTEDITYELLGWITNENNQREKLAKRQKELFDEINSSK